MEPVEGVLAAERGLQEGNECWSLETGGDKETKKDVEGFILSSNIAFHQLHDELQRSLHSFSPEVGPAQEASSKIYFTLHTAVGSPDTSLSLEVPFPAEDSCPQRGGNQTPE